jgi:phosphotransferase system enzyme I (PtsI)
LLKGIPISEGYAISKVYKLNSTAIDVSKKIVKDTKKELLLFDEAINMTVMQLESLKKDTLYKYGEETAKIFDAHIMIATDIEIKKQVSDLVSGESCNFIYALDKVVSQYALIFSNMDDPYLKERAHDLIDVSNRIIKNASGVMDVDLSLIHEKVILVAHELSPSQTAMLNPKYIVGFCTEVGGKTSHSAIIARMMGIPSITSIQNLMERVSNQQEVILDGYLGQLHLNYTKELKASILSKIEMISDKQKALTFYKGRETVTLDLKKFQLLSNIGSSKDLEFVMNHDAEGIGLYRTELLYIDQKSLPSIPFQIDEYKRVLESLYPKKVIIRTLDIGGDKKLPYLTYDHEDNPYLGRRGLRLSLIEKEMFVAQIKALILANTKGNLKIMFPMVSTLDEYLKAKEIVLSIQKELNDLKEIPLGIMIEVPSAALISDQLAKHVDFFSIGTNDLVQYTLASDRTNQKVTDLYQPFHPSVLRLISMVASAAKKHQIECGVCGEMASDPLAIPLLLGLGINSLSMMPSEILKARRMISKMNLTDMRKISKKVLNLDSEKKVIKYLKKHINLEDFHG